ncbi:MAG: preprotein translocase subunit SecE [Solirubrobacterales bacterium]
MAKSRAQRKAERRKREAQQAAQAGQARAEESRAQHDTQVPESADVIEAELAEKGADLEALKQSEAPAAPAPSRADVGAPDEPTEAKLSRREQRREEREAAARRKESEERRKPRDEPVERQRGRVVAFIASCWAELKRVQWPDRETLIQASAITLIFIAVAAAYLGVLDAIFSELVKIVL